jgi:Kdo2-lipid IVA lauroyltransferase/acyltransferase
MSGKKNKNSYKCIYYPLVWLVIGILWLLVQLPYWLQLFLGKLIGLAIFRLDKKSKHIAKVNVDLCFPKLNEKEKEKILRESFISLGISFFEMGLAAFAAEKRLQSLVHLQGEHYLEEAKRNGCGVILLGAHLATIDIASRMFVMCQEFAIVYRAHKKPWADYFLNILRRHYKQKIERNNVRGLIKALKSGSAVCYAPDIDAGYYDNVFVPFFGVLASSISATSRLAKITNAKVLPCAYYRRDDGAGYDIVIYPPLENFPSDDVAKDVARINLETEKAVLKKPGQYIWQYKRFKTRPKGEKRFY